MNTSYHKKNLINKNIVPVDVAFIIKRLEKAGFSAFLVGGCVRDLLIKKAVRDWDIITDAAPGQIKKVFYAYKTILIGKSSLTVTIVLNCKTYQITSLRNNNGQCLSSKNGKNYQNLKADLISRDFTIDSICWSQNTGIIDPSEGLKDLSQKIIRSIDPDLRFKDDPLRMLRAIRLACELDFSIEYATKKSLCKNNFLIQKVSPERIRNEIKLILSNPKAKKGVLLLYHYGFICKIISLDGIKKTQINIEKQNKHLLSVLGNKKHDLVFQLAILGRLFYNSCKIAGIFYLPIVRYLKFKKKTIESVRILLNKEWEYIDFSSNVKIRFILSEFGVINTRRLFLLKKALLETEKQLYKKHNLKFEETLLEAEIKKNNPVSLSDLAIGGDEVRKMGVPEGKEIRKILESALREVLINPDNNHKDYLLKYIKIIIKKDNYMI